MAKPKAGLFFLSSSGTIGKAVTFVQGRRYQAVRSHFTPTDRKSASQLLVRGCFREASEAWKYPNFTNLDKKAWNLRGKLQDLCCTGRNAFMKCHIERYCGIPFAYLYDAHTTPAPPGFNFLITSSVTGVMTILVIRGAGAGLTVGQPCVAGVPVTWYIASPQPTSIIVLYADDLVSAKGESGWFRATKSMI